MGYPTEEYSPHFRGRSKNRRLSTCGFLFTCLLQLFCFVVLFFLPKSSLLLWASLNVHPASHFSSSSWIRHSKMASLNHLSEGHNAREATLLCDYKVEIHVPGSQAPLAYLRFL